MNNFTDQELRGLIHGQRLQNSRLAERIAKLEGALLANNVAIQVLIAHSPDLDRTERGLRSALDSAGEMPAESGDEVIGFRTTAELLLKRVASARAKAAPPDPQD